MDKEHGLAPAWVVAGDSRGTAEDLPQQRGVLPAVLDEHILQGFCPVELIEDDGGWVGGRRELAWGGLSCPLPYHHDIHALAPVQKACLLSVWSFPPFLARFAPPSPRRFLVLTFPSC